VPNRRRRRLSTATSAVAALAVVSPFAISAITDMTKPAPQPREFRSAAMVTDLPNELMSALSQGLSQFGINLPSMPSSLTGADAGMPTTLTSPNALASPGLTPGLTSPAATPGLTSPAATPGLTSPALTPGLATPGVNPATAPAALPPLTDPSMTSTALTNPATAATAGTPGLPGLGAGATPAANPALNPALTSPTGAAPAGLTTPPVTGLDPGLATAPISNATGLPNPGEVPISAPIGLDSTGLGGAGAQTFPLLGGGSDLGTAMPAATSGGSSGLLGDLSSAAQQLGANQAIDLLKGVVMPMITSAMKPAAAAPPAPPVPAPPPPAG
jgi:hypothetical protein